MKRNGYLQELNVVTFSVNVIIPSKSIVYDAYFLVFVCANVF
jgi:hypothetical protein